MLQNSAAGEIPYLVIHSPLWTRIASKLDCSTNHIWMSEIFLWISNNYPRRI